MKKEKEFKENKFKFIDNLIKVQKENCFNKKKKERKPRIYFK